MGGDDSKLFVHDLLAAYLKYAARLGLKSTLLYSENGHAIVQICGKKAGFYFQHESGKHTIQRVPPTESNGRKQTSIVVVGVLPIPPKKSFRPLPEKDLDIVYKVGSGPGGQHRNKTATTVVMTHKPTGMRVKIDTRSQAENKRIALDVLTARVNELSQGKVAAGYANLRKEQLADSGRSDKIRTYNYLESRAVDHRLGTKTSNVREVIEKGRFELLTNIERSS